MHMLRISNLWLDGNYGSVGSVAPHGIYLYSTGTDSSGDPPTSPDSDCTIHDLFISGFYTGTRHGIYLEGNSGNIRGSMIDRIYGRFFSGNGIFINGSPDGHLSNAQIGDAARGGVGNNSGTDFAGFRVASSNIKFSNIKAFYCGAAAGQSNTLGWGMWFTNSRGLGSVLEVQDSASGFFFDGSPYTVSAVLSDTCLDVGVRISTNRITATGVQVMLRGGARYTTQIRGIWIDSTYNNCQVLADIDPANITTPIQNFAGLSGGLRNFVRISDNTTLNSVG